jgi:hypothetical protein
MNKSPELSLYSAVADGDLGAVERLLGQGIDPKVMKSPEGGFARPLVALAAFYGRIDVLRLLMAAAPGFGLNEALRDVSVVEDDAVAAECAALVLAAGASPTHDDSVAMRWAAVRGQRAVVRALVEAGASLDSLDDAVQWADEHFITLGRRKRVAGTVAWAKATFGGGRSVGQELLALGA